MASEQMKPGWRWWAIIHSSMFDENLKSISEQTLHTKSVMR